MVRIVVQEAEDTTIPEDSILRAKLIEIVEKTINWNDRTTNEKKSADIYEWWFEISAGDGVSEGIAGRRIKGSTDSKVTNRSKFAKWYEAMMGRPLPIGLDFDTDDMLGLEADILVGHRRSKDRVFEEVSEVMNPNVDPWALDGGNQDSVPPF